MTFDEIIESKQAEHDKWEADPNSKEYENPCLPLLTVGDLIDELKTHNPKALVAIQNNGRDGVTLSKVGDVEGIYYMKKNPRLQKSFKNGGDLTEKERNEMTEVVVFHSQISNDEIKDTGADK